MSTDEAQKRREARFNAAAKTRDWGTVMMFAGGITLGIALTAFVLSEAAQIQSWVRQTILTLIAILFSSGVALHAVGRASRRTLAQLADDREELMTILREIKRNQTFLMARPGAPGAAGTLHPPGPDTLDMVYRIKEQRDNGGRDTGEAKPPKPKNDNARGLGELVDMAEWYNLGAEVERRRHEPPPDPPKSNN